MQIVDESDFLKSKEILHKQVAFLWLLYWLLVNLKLKDGVKFIYSEKPTEIWEISLFHHYQVMSNKIGSIQSLTGL